MSVADDWERLQIKLAAAKKAVEKVEKEIFSLQVNCEHKYKRHSGWGSYYDWTCPECRASWDD